MCAGSSDKHRIPSCYFGRNEAADGCVRGGLDKEGKIRESDRFDRFSRVTRSESCIWYCRVYIGVESRAAEVTFAGIAAQTYRNADGLGIV